MTQTISQAVAVQDNSPAGLVRKYETDLTSTLPSHIDHTQWMSVAVGALRRDPKVAEAAQNNVGAFLSAMLTAARLGLEPGTEAFYLVPQAPKAGQPLEIMGVVGYQGLVELIYRAGAVSSVIAEVVYEHDGFEYQPGLHERPLHKIDWDSDDRGRLRLVYAYAIMKDGATSKVVVLNRSDIARIRSSSRSAKSEYSPWNKHEAAMWAKSAVRQLAKWVPTSAEYRKEQLRAAMDVAAEAGRVGHQLMPEATRIEPIAPNIGEHIDPVTGEVYDDDGPVDAELVDDSPHPPAPARSTAAEVDGWPPVPDIKP